MPLKSMLRRAHKAEKTNQKWIKAWDWGDEVDLVQGLLDKNPVEVVRNRTNVRSSAVGLALIMKH